MQARQADDTGSAFGAEVGAAPRRVPRRHRARWHRLLSAVVLGGTAAVLAAFVTVPTTAGAATSSAPGVTSTAINTGAISTLSGSIASDFAGLVPGVKAYFDMVNAKGGINGRKLNLAYNLDDGGSSSQFNSQAHALVQQDHVFAVTGVSTYWFTPSFFTDAKIPTYGYNVSGNWSGPDNLFAAGGDGQCYSCSVPFYSYVVQKVAKAKSVALLAYNVSSSADACEATANALKKAGINVSYTDFSVPIDGNIAPDVQRMQRAGSDFVMSCMDVTENVALARAIKQYGLKMKQLWLNGSDQSVLNKYSSLMQGVYFFLQNVPLTAPTKYYPGLKAYLAAMKKYQPSYVGDALAIQGWESAALFAAGVTAAGSNLTQQRVVDLTNKMTNFTADGLTTVTNWTNAHTNVDILPNCAALTVVKGSKLQPIYYTGHQVFTCFNKGVKNPKPVPAPAGTPGT